MVQTEVCLLTCRHRPCPTEHQSLSIAVERPGVLGFGELLTGNLEGELWLEF